MEIPYPFIQDFLEESMGLAKKQVAERRYFEQFRDHYQLPVGEIEFGDKPDIIIRSQPTIGIEIAALYKLDGRMPHSEQQQSPDRERVIRLAESSHIYNGGRPVEVNVGFDPRYPIERQRLRPLSEALAQLVGGIADSEVPCTLRSPLPDWPELEFVYHSGQIYTNSAWKLVQSYDVPDLSIERVTEVVKRKVEKVKGYELCDKYWLLLTVDFWNPAQDQGVTWPVNASLLQTPFERILIYKTGLSEVIEVIQR